MIYAITACLRLKSVARAFHEIYFLERAYQIQVKALSSATLHYPSPKVCEHTLQQFEKSDGQKRLFKLL